MTRPLGIAVIVACSLLSSTPFISNYANSANADPVDILAHSLLLIINNATIKGEKVRQCTCDEQINCADDMSILAWQCEEDCWHKWKSVGW